MTSERVLASPLLAEVAGLRHGFSTRRGGVSVGPFASLNLGFNVGDDPTAVASNLAAFVADAGLPERVRTVSQVHGARVVTVASREDETKHVEADGLVTCVPGVTLAVRTADCIPLLMVDPEVRVIAAVHAGWRGVAARVTTAALEAMCVLGAERSRVVVALGPSIGFGAFEVGEEVVEMFLASGHLRQAGVGDGGDDPALVRQGAANGSKWRIDLAELAKRELCEGGVGRARISHVERCTHAEGDWFFSYRRDGQRSGRMLSAIGYAAT